MSPPLLTLSITSALTMGNRIATEWVIYPLLYTFNGNSGKLRMLSRVANPHNLLFFTQERGCHVPTI